MPKRPPQAMLTIRVLQVEDNELDAELVLAELDADDIRHEARVVDDQAGFLAALDEFDPHIVLSDLSLPGFSGQHALELLRERDEDLPFIFVSATLGEEAAVKALRNGATDYILKQNPARLASAVRRALAEVEARRSNRRAEAELMRAQRFESLAMLAGGLSHDLRNLLQPLLLAGDSLQDYKDDPRLARLGKLVRDCGKRGLDMVQSMLSFASGARRAEQVRGVQPREPPVAPADRSPYRLHDHRRSHCPTLLLITTDPVLTSRTRSHMLAIGIGETLHFRHRAVLECGVERGRTCSRY